MAESIRIDSHKLVYHPKRVAKWLDGEITYPIELEIGISGACNHRCIFCSCRHMGYKANYLDTDVVVDNMRTLGKLGLKSVVFAGEGEPLLHKDAAYIFTETKKAGIDVALSTNGVLFTKDVAEKCLPSMTWIRFSIAAASDKVHKVISGGGIWRHQSDLSKSA